MRCDDETVQFCSKHAAVMDNYGGEYHNVASHYSTGWAGIPGVPNDSRTPASRKSKNQRLDPATMEMPKRRGYFRVQPGNSN